MRIALAGNPNSGKTTMYNALTGSNEKVGNWAGVTIAIKEAPLKKSYQSLEEITIVDLPGTYSIDAYTSEEKISDDFISSKDIDIIVNIVDANNLSRSLFFTTQLLNLGIPVLIALNKSDQTNKTIDVKKLSELLNCPIVETIATAKQNNGLIKLIEKAQSLKNQVPKINFVINNKRERYAFIEDVVAQIETVKHDETAINLSDKIDNLLINKWLGIPIFILVMWLVFDISQATVGPYFADLLVGQIEAFQEYIRTLTASASPFMQALLVDGIIGGVGAVVGFLPLVMVMYFLIALLEDCGYMARVSVVMDPIFKKVGLSGKSIIPMIIGTGCAIPGIMACRTIKNDDERKATAMLTPFMPCGAKLPVIALFASVFFKNASWVGTLMYILGIVIIFIAAFIIKKITGRKDKSYFIIELPEYKIPSVILACKQMFSRAKDYIIKAGTIILLCNASVQIMQSFTWNLTLVEEGMESSSILASVASPFALLLIPLGFGAWQLAVAAITGFIAKENVIGTLAVVYSITNLIDVDTMAIIGQTENEVMNVLALNKVAALAYLLFILFTPPCFAAIGAMNSELKNKRYLFAGISLQFLVGYTLAFITYQVGTFLTYNNLAQGTLEGLLIIALLSLLTYYLIKDKKITKQMCEVVK